MPQHPKYSNSPARDLRRLYQLLDDLECYGFVHEDIHQNLDVVMSQLHPEATRELVRQESGSEDGEVSEEDMFIPGASALFHYVAPQDQPQFIQDLRNLIAHCMFSDSWSTDGVADQIRAERNIEFKPARPGAYEISPTEYDPRHGGFAYWDGRRWYGSKVLLADCLSQPRTDEYAARWDYCWRGFLEPQD